ncbi:spinster family MFS transporter [Terricaulis sp.]|uniref:spinster family MFS transporter n=1 Tax=Terricaulis sp. TaxID=2768686 RepID=UPI0037835523
MTEAQTASAPANRYAVLGLLFLVYTFNFIDRQIIGILAHPIQETLHIDDAQMGLLGGLAFAMLYTGLGIPVAWLADRWSRTWIMTIALTLWSGFTALCGFTTTFGQLFLARMGVGVGEAGGVAPAYSLISDYFPPKERARALAVYSFGIPIGSAAGIALGGIVATLVDWRVAFIVVGVAGLIIAPIFRAFVREPVRGGLDAKPEAQAKAGFFEALGVVMKKPSFWLLSFGASCSSIMGYGSFFWIPSFLQRSYHFDLQQAAFFYSAILLVGGVIGVWLGGLLGDKLGGKRKAMFALVPAAAWILAAPFFAMGLLSNSPALAFALFLVPTALGLVWLGPIITAFQHMAPANMRTTSSAAFLFINNLIGIGLGTYLLGQLSVMLHAQYGEDSLRYSILYGAGFYVAAAVLALIAAFRLKKDWVD